MTNPHYETLGGEAKVRELVERFYELSPSTVPEIDIELWLYCFENARLD